MERKSSNLETNGLMQLISDKVTVNATKETVANFLKDSSNFIHLLPTEQVSDFKATKEECSFKVQGGITISLVQDGEETDKIYMRSGEKSPFPFRLTLHTTDQGTVTEGYIEFNGEVNVFLKMMVEKPLTALFNIMSSKLKDHFAG
jgi:carbon monoxide dehydrogenase subunit G